jgi:hypothetical protein
MPRSHGGAQQSDKVVRHSPQCRRPYSHSRSRKPYEIPLLTWREYSATVALHSGVPPLPKKMSADDACTLRRKLCQRECLIAPYYTAAPCPCSRHHRHSANANSSGKALPTAPIPSGQARGGIQ